MYIAADLVEERYRGGPSEPFHILDLAKIDGSERVPWLTMRLDQVFRYGQTRSSSSSKDTKTKVERWLVYDPSVASFQPQPRIFQHRFTGSRVADYAMLAAAHAPSLNWAEQTVAAGREAWVYLVNALRSVVGHELHNFLDQPSLYEVSKAYIDPEGSARKQISHPPPSVPLASYCYWVRLVLLQGSEGVQATAQNKRTDEETKTRLNEQNSTAADERNFWEKLRDSFEGEKLSASRPVIKEQHLTILGYGDADAVFTAAALANSSELAKLQELVGPTSKDWASEIARLLQDVEAAASSKPDGTKSTLPTGNQYTSQAEAPVSDLDRKKFEAELLLWKSNFNNTKAGKYVEAQNKTQSDPHTRNTSNSTTNPSMQRNIPHGSEQIPNMTSEQIPSRTSDKIQNRPRSHSVVNQLKG